MNNGWIKLHRGLLEWEWYDDINTKVLFLHLLLKANHKEKKYRGKVIKVGQVMTGRKLLSLETGLTEQQIRTSLSKLKSTNEITIESNVQGTIIQVVKYKEYQVLTNEVTNEQPTSNQRATTNNNDNKEKNENINYIYSLYPTKCFVNGRQITKGKKAKDKIKSLLNKGETKDSLESKIKWFLNNRKKEGVFLPDFTKFLGNLPEIKVELPKNKFESYMQELEDEDKKVDTIQLYNDLEAKLITPEEFKEIKRVSDANYIKKVNRA